MTRAALLSLLSAPASLPAAAVQDLEQLAQAFPYCQTAHLLLAKAAHDQGSMLAGQRLRRAATYAADRQLLRELLERPAADFAGHDEAAPTDLPIAAAIAPLAPVETPVVTDAQPDALSEERGIKTDLATVVAAQEAPAGEGVATFAEPISLPIQPAELGAVEITEVAAAPRRQPDELGEVAAAPDTSEPPTEPAREAEAPAAAQADAAPAHEMLTSSGGDSAAEFAPAEASSVPDAPIPAPADAPGLSAAAITSAAAEPASGPLPIQPSAEAGTARFEFGLSSVLETEFSTYQLADPLAGPAKLPAAPVRATAGPAPFAGSGETPYALPGGSRLGYALLAAPPAGGPSQPWAAAEAPGATLPLPAEFFPPDALLLEYLASQPLSPSPAVPVPSPVDLIDSFLRRAPQRRRGIVTLLTVPEQADLSMRSTQAESDLASESLARILAGQGKTDRAISVYERLMVRQPEKSAYFAVQIELLRNPPTPSS